MTSGNKRVVVIGAGVAGMTAAIHARACGFDVDVFERHTVPGGLCTSWRVDGFLFDGCVEFFVGSGPSSPFHRLWREVGVIPRAFVNRDVYAETRLADGQRVLMYAEPNKLQAHFDAISPRDHALTAELCHLVRLMQSAKFRVDRAPELQSLREKFRAMLDLWPSMQLWRDGFASSIRSFAQRFESPALRAALMHAIPADLPLLFLVQVLADLANGAAGSPLGGSLQIGLSMARRCKALGVRMHMGVEVDRIDVERGVAVGITTSDGRSIPADVVIAAGDLRVTLDRLLQGRVSSPAHEALFRKPLVPTVALVSCGLREPRGSDVDAVIHRHVFATPRTIAGHTLEALAWKSFLHDSSLAPEGKTIVTITVDSRWEHWAPLADDRARYDAARAELGDGIIAAMDEALPGFSSVVQTVDVATPLTVERYTLNQHGHYMTFMPSLGRPPERVPRTLPGVRALYLAGMWVEPPGGLPNALRSGRDTVEVLCRDHSTPFCPAAATLAEA